MIKSESLPSGFVYVEEGSNIFYHYIKSSNQPLDSSKLLGTSIIKIFLQSLIAFSQHYKDHYRVLNLLSFLQSACDWSSDFTASTRIAFVISLLVHYLTACTLDGQPDENME